MKPLTDIGSLGTILSVWAHPDDESYSCAGIMAKAVQNGQTVVCITATKGELGIRDTKRWPAEKLGDIRAAELRAALDVLGVERHHWLGYADGGCRQVSTEEAAGKIKVFIDQYQPDTILTFGPDGLTGHDDHRSVSAWVDEAVKGSDIKVYHTVQLRDCYEKMRDADEKFNIFFNIDQPPLVDTDQCDLLLCLNDAQLEQKYRCLRAMPSQTEAMFRTFDHDTICAMVCCEAFIRTKSRSVARAV